MNIKPIRTRRDYEGALKSIEGLMNAKRNSPEGDRLDVLVTRLRGPQPQTLTHDGDGVEAAQRSWDSSRIPD